uniref:NAD(P)-dependent dehydrogenase, short-chain alcohol dehydrogenase family n=1 Tax=Candidatus Kentrum sp. DK TaxID=2126562 RepID=A0A450RWA0_9GAMM|nr:MAG: NAD(P)-dependent dehydrogenase, short-chain alcohol dehydrogenase family [Candidatus Kentron sp. DK]
MNEIKPVETHNNRFSLSGPYRPGADLLAGRVILVTGAGADLGRAAACAFAAQGAAIVLLDHDVPAMEEVYDTIVQAGGAEPALYPMRFTGAVPTDYEEMAERIKTEFGRLDGLLHAGLELGVPSPIEHYDITQWAKVMQNNLHAPFLLVKACLPLLRETGDASVILTSADVGRRGRAYWGAYGVSCFAVEGLIQVLADELETESRVRINGIDPGPVRTRLRAAAYPGEDPMTLPHPDEKTGAYLFLMGKDSHPLNGAVIEAYGDDARQNPPKGDEAGGAG